MPPEKLEEPGGFALFLRNLGLGPAFLRCHPLNHTQYQSLAVKDTIALKGVIYDPSDYP
jgi:hypothetical protein